MSGEVKAAVLILPYRSPRLLMAALPTTMAIHMKRWALFNLLGPMYQGGSDHLQASLYKRKKGLGNTEAFLLVSKQRIT
jgi:hypothetical protein